MEQVVFKMDNVKKRFGNVQALNGLSFSVTENEFVALVGNNGSGKTTIINTLCNIIPYDSGLIEIFGRKLTSNLVSYRDKIGAILSESILIYDFTPYQYLNFVSKFHRINKDSFEIRVQELSNFMRLDNYKTKQIGAFSSGDKIKISLAASLIHNPELLLYDEPFIHLDIQSIDMICNLLSSFRGKKTLFITSHNLDLILNLCDRVLLIDNGRIIDDLQINNTFTIEKVKLEIKSRLINKESKMKNFSWLG